MAKDKITVLMAKSKMAISVAILNDNIEWQKVEWQKVEWQD
ncbi:hypothetical protein [Methanosarcina barkeri]|nr:hypothetical protein [Methanosarcina barkeri]